MAASENRTDTPTAIGEWLYAARSQRGLTQEEVAGAADVDTTYVSKIELGKKKPSRKVITKLANALLPKGADEQTVRSLLNAGLAAAGFMPADTTAPVEYEPDPDLQLIVEEATGNRDSRKALSSMAAALRASRANAIGKRAE